VPDGTRINISGCVHACGKHHIADIGLQGANVRVDDEVIEAADIFEGGSLGHEGRLGTRTAEKVPMADIADAIERRLQAAAPAVSTGGSPCAVAATADGGRNLRAHQ
jgi:ferredoxin-nitrite reductase